MTTNTETRPARAAGSALPRPALVAALLVLLTSAVGAYGAIYFTGLEGWEAMGLTFLTTYEYVALTGLAASVALLRGHHLGLVGVLWYGTFQVLFTSFKLVSIHETEAIPFGVVGVLVLVLATRPSVRAYASR